MISESMRLRFESSDGCWAKEYRIEDGRVEVRAADPRAASVQDSGNVWRRLTPKQLSVHVERNSVVAQWLTRRLGWRRLLQACLVEEPNAWKVASSTGL